MDCRGRGGTVEKMQGQQAEAVIVSCGVSDPDFALQEAEFIYALHRLNVAITRARSKSIVCLPEPLVRANPQVLEIPDAEQGLAFMRRLIDLTRAYGEVETFDLGDGITAEVLRTSEVIPLEIPLRCATEGPTLKSHLEFLPAEAPKKKPIVT